MKLDRVYKIGLSLIACVVLAFGRGEEININFKNLEIVDLIKITSKLIDKNILLTTDVTGKVDFVSNKPVDKEDILNILMYTLEPKGFTIVENDGILRVVRINDVSKYNTPVVSETIDTYQMITEVFTVKNGNVDVMSSRIRHLISTSAKLVTDKESNAIVITDFVSNIKTIKAVINLLSIDAQKHIEEVKLKNLKAADIQPELVTMAKTIYNEQIETEKVAILLNKDTNSLMFVGKKENVEYLSKYIKTVDLEGSLVAKTVEVITLKNAEAKAVVTMINGIIANKQYKDPNQKPYASSDNESNSVILMGQKDELEYYKDLINKLDIDRQQVYVQARIIEVSEKGLSNMGIKYGIEGLKSGGAGALTFAGNLGGASIALSPATLSQVTLPKVSDGVVLGASINLLKQNSALDVVSEPSILCINNKESSIYVGETTSTATQTNNGTTTSTSYKREDIGLKLKVKPRISNGDKVTLEINAVLEDISKLYTDGTPPDTNKKELSTLAIVNNGESVILGGLIKNKLLNSEDKVPFFGDIPLIGRLFKNNTDTADKTNLVIIVTPYIIPKSKDLTYVRNQLAELKLLEEKFTKKAELRLEKLKLRNSDESLEIDQQLLDLEDDKVDAKEDRIDFELDKKEYFDEKTAGEDEKLQKIKEKQQELEKERLEKEEEALEEKRKELEKQKELEAEKLNAEVKAKALEEEKKSTQEIN